MYINKDTKHYATHMFSQELKIDQARIFFQAVTDSISTTAAAAAADDDDDDNNREEQEERRKKKVQKYENNACSNNTLCPRPQKYHLTHDGNSVKSRRLPNVLYGNLTDFSSVKEF